MSIKPYPLPTDIPNSKSRFDQLPAGSQEPIPMSATPLIPGGTFKEVKDPATGKLSMVFEKNETSSPGRTIPAYIPSDDIKEVVRLAQILKRPILIKGEPGSGKTQLSRAVAYEWYGDNYKQHYFEWVIKSTSKAVDGIYSFDHIERLREAQLLQHSGVNGKMPVEKYRKFGPMGMAFLTSNVENPSILLIDEIDKADIDFPNDLLMELDEQRFDIPETGELIEASAPPIIFITSNDERELPEAFLRRCLFLYIKFPDDKQMKMIIEAHLPDLVNFQRNTINLFIDLIITQFKVLKDQREKDPADNKRVSTSELLDWLTAFNHDRISATGPFSNQKLPFDSLPQLIQLLKGDTVTTDPDSAKELEQQALSIYPFYFHAVLKSFAAVQSQNQKVTK